jgi:hypothetical protein
VDEILWYDLDFFIEDSDGSERGECVRDPPFKETGCGVEKDLEKKRQHCLQTNPQADSVCLAIKAGLPLSSADQEIHAVKRS